LVSLGVCSYWLPFTSWLLSGVVKHSV